MNLDRYPLWLVFVASLVLMLGAATLGRALGMVAAASGASGSVTLEGIVLGLLSLIMGFSLAAALSTFDARRAAVLNEATAIGTTALRARLLPAPHDKEVLALLLEYVQLRLDAVKNAPSVSRLAPLISRSSALQEQLWQHAMTLTQESNRLVPTGLFIQSLNEMIDNQDRRLAAALFRLPNLLMLVLHGIAATGIGFASYGETLRGSHAPAPVLILGLLVCSVLLLIQDIDRLSSGFINVNQQPIVTVATNIAAMMVPSR